MCSIFTILYIEGNVRVIAGKFYPIIPLLLHLLSDLIADLLIIIEDNQELWAGNMIYQQERPRI